VKASLLSITFLNSTTYAFVPLSRAIFIKSLDYEEYRCFRPKNEAAHSLQSFTEGRFLVSGLVNGSVVIYRTDRLPKLLMICSEQAHEAGKSVSSIEKARINGKECIVTHELDGVISVWYMIKGRMRRLRTIMIQDVIYGFVYVEEHKMLAISCGEGADSVKFLSLISGRVECRLDLQMKDARNLFLMEGKNAIGVLGEQASQIKIVQLCSP